MTKLTQYEKELLETAYGVERSSFASQTFVKEIYTRAILMMQGQSTAAKNSIADYFATQVILLLNDNMIWYSNVKGNIKGECPPHLMNAKKLIADNLFACRNKFQDLAPIIKIHHSHVDWFYVSIDEAALTIPNVNMNVIINTKMALSKEAPHPLPFNKDFSTASFVITFALLALIQNMLYQSDEDTLHFNNSGQYTVLLSVIVAYIAGILKPQLFEKNITKLVNEQLILAINFPEENAAKAAEETSSPTLSIINPKTKTRLPAHDRIAKMYSVEISFTVKPMTAANPAPNSQIESVQNDPAPEPQQPPREKTLKQYKNGKGAASAVSDSGLFSTSKPRDPAAVFSENLTNFNPAHFIKLEGNNLPKDAGVYAYWDEDALDEAITDPIIKNSLFNAFKKGVTVGPINKQGFKYEDDKATGKKILTIKIVGNEARVFAPNKDVITDGRNKFYTFNCYSPQGLHHSNANARQAALLNRIK